MIPASNPNLFVAISNLLLLSQWIVDTTDNGYSNWVYTIVEANHIKYITVVTMWHGKQWTSYQQVVDFLFLREVLLEHTKAIKWGFVSPYDMVVYEFNKKIDNQILSNECRLLSMYI